MGLKGGKKSTGKVQCNGYCCQCGQVGTHGKVVP